MTPAEQKDEQFYRDTESVAFPKLDDRQLSLLEPLGERRVLKRGDLVYKAGQRDLGLAIVLRGEIQAFEQRDDTEQILATAHERDFLGDVAMLQGTSALASARVTSPECEILYIPAANLQRAFAELPGVSATIVNALIMRRRRLRRDPEFAGLRVLAARGDRDGRQLDDFLDKNHIPHRLIDFESEQGQALSKRLHVTNRDLPVLITPAGTPLRRPSLREVAQVVGLLRPLAFENETEITADLAIVGAGPAGLAAAVYAASEGLKTVVLESYAPGGQAGSSSLIENFFGFPTGISGGDLTWLAQLQAYRFGAKFSTPSQALSLNYNGTGDYPACLQVDGCGAVLHAKSVLIATGADYRRLDAEGREQFEGMGVYYAATALEGKICRGAISLNYNGTGEYRACLQVDGCGAVLHAKSVLIATGADYRRLDAEGREQFEGMGVYYAATALEGKICRGATVIVVGSGNSAGQAAMFLSDGAAKVLLVVRGDDLSKMSTYLSRRVTKQKNIEILYHTQIRKLTGNKMLEEAELENTKTGERRVVRTPAIFSMIGANPCTEWLPSEIERDEKGFIKTGTDVTNTPGWKENKRKPAALETSVPNIFAAGDVRSGSIKRCAAAVGEGGMAIAGIQTALAASAEPN